MKIKVTLQVLKKTEIKSSVTIQIKFRNCLTTIALDMKSSTYLKNLFFNIRRICQQSYLKNKQIKQTFNNTR